MSVGKQSGRAPPGLLQALRRPHALPFLIVSLGQAHGWPVTLYSAMEPAIISAAIVASVSTSLVVEFFGAVSVCGGKLSARSAAL